MAADSCRQALRTATGAARGDPPNPADRSHPVCGLELRRKLRRQLLHWCAEPTGWTVGNPVRDGPASGNSADRLGRVLGHDRSRLRLAAAANHGSATGELRGFFDYATGQVVRIASVTDGTSNTLIVGEVLPWQDCRQQLLDIQRLHGRDDRAAQLAERTRRFARTPPGPLSARPTGSADLATRPRGSRAHTRWRQLLSRGRVGAVPQGVHQPGNLLPLGSRAGVEVVSSDAY